jgi:hypothetical protein
MGGLRSYLTWTLKRTQQHLKLRKKTLTLTEDRGLSFVSENEELLWLISVNASRRALRRANVKSSKRHPAYINAK